jgi:SagB-type dehydrogenase family enzyme
MTVSYRKFMSTIGLEATDTELMELFHQSTKVAYSTALKRDIRIGAYLFDPRCVLEASRNRKLYQASATINLPKPQALNMPLDQVFERRQSCRSFAHVDISQQALSNVLNSLRITRRGYSAEFPDIPMSMRTYPSPGGLYPVEVYVVALNVEGIAPGAYHFNFEQHSLELVTNLPDAEQFALMVGDHDQIAATQAGFAVILSAVFPRSTIKYEGLGYRFSLIEAGIVGQHLALAATAQGIAHLNWGAYYDDPLHRWLHLDGVEEAICNFLWFGQKDNQ